MNRKQKRKQVKGTRRGPREISGLGHIPPFTPTLRTTHKFRFVNGANNGTYTITRAQLLNLVLYTPTTSTSVRLFEAVRLVGLEMWSSPAALGSQASQLSLEWLGENGPSTIVSDTSIGVSPAHIRSSPPSRSSCEWWSMSGQQEADDLFVLVIPVNTTIDVTMALRFVENEAPTEGDAPTGATVGRLYGDYLDGLVSGMLAPVGYIALP
jgi:hypothetical protein